MMISNQYQTQTNFQGNLLKEGIKLPKKKFNEVAKLYAEKTPNLPDLKLIGRLNNSDFDGQFFHSTHAIVNGEDVASIPTKSLKEIFKMDSPMEIAEELVNITKQFGAQERISTLVSEIDSLKGKIQNIKIQLKHTSDPLTRKRLDVLEARMKGTLENKWNEYENLMSSRNEFSAEWCV